MKSQPPKLGRRQFLKLAGVTGVVAIPALLGYDLLRDAQGEYPPNLSPYVPTEVMESWSSHPQEASPILLLINERAGNPFGAYLAEILRTEGLNCFQVARPSNLANAPLVWHDLIILAEGPLSNNQVAILESYVAKGGRLVAMRPDTRLASLFGVEPVAGTTTEGYLQVEPSHSIGQGIVMGTLQFHGTADHYRLAGAQAIAWLASDANTQTDFPAVTLFNYGQGQAALWAFDLARSVAYTRQGNPAWANQERDGGLGIRAADMFKGWVDLDRIHIPQADIQQRFLVNLLTALSQDARPLPRLWYFPGAANSTFIATGDAHKIPAYAIEEALTRVEQRGGHMSIYNSPYLHKPLRRAANHVRFWATDIKLVGEALAQQFPSATSSHVADWRARGHEFALHPYVGQDGICAQYMSGGELATPSLEAGWRRYWEEFTGLGYGPLPPTVRTHCVLWTGWVETARLQAALGMRMNLDYYHWGPAFRKGTGEWAYGHFTGSGLPMKFVDEQGRILNIYQQLTQLADDHLLDLRWGGYEWGGQAKISAEAALEVSQMLIDRSLSNHCAIAANFHPDLFFVAPFAADEISHAEAELWLEGTLDYAAAQGIPIWSALEWLRFAETRHDASLVAVQWHQAPQRLSFRLAAQPDATGKLTVMVPLRHGDAVLTQLMLDGLATPHSERTIGGVSYGWISVDPGPHQIVADYT